LKSFERIVALHRVLSQRRTPIALQNITQTLDCSNATAKRAIQALRDLFNAPLKYNRERNGYYYAKSDDADIRFELPGLWLNPSELHALLVSNHLLKKLQPGVLDGHIKPLRSRIEKLLMLGEVQGDEIVKRIRIIQVGSRPTQLDVFQKVASTLIERKRLHILYHSRSGDQTTERDVSPQRLVYYRDNWYLDAWCHLRGDLRIFSLDRIYPVYTDDRMAKNVSENKLNQLLTQSYGIFSGSPKYTAVLHFAPEAAKWVADERWYPKQQQTILQDGGLELRVPYNDPTELLMDILKHGPNVEVLAPAALRDAVVERLRAALGHYG